MNSRIVNADTLTDHGNRTARRAVVDILEAGLRAADPYFGVAQLLRIEGSRLTIGNSALAPVGDPLAERSEIVDLDGIDRVFVFGAAKGVQRVARALEDCLGDRLTGGHVIAKHDDEHLCERIGVTYGAHPVPDQGCVDGCLRIVEMCKGLTERDLVITIGGSGISSLLTLPSEGITLEEVRDLTYQMQIERGVPTNDLNQVRNHIDQLKGGKISRLLKPARVVHLIAKETMPYQSLIGGRYFVHFFPDSSSFADSVGILKRWHAWDDVSESIRRHLTLASEADETVKTPEYLSMNARAFSLLSRDSGMLETAERRARELGYTPYRLATLLQAEAREAGFMTADIALNVAKENRPFATPCALISGGELLVTVGRETGVGGRNQEFALAAATRIGGNPRVAIGAVDSDGTDGPGGQFREEGETIPCLAGGVVDGETLGDAKANGLDLHESLRRHDTSAPLWRLKSGVLATHSVSLLDLRVAVITDRRR